MLSYKFINNVDIQSKLNTAEMYLPKETNKVPPALKEKWALKSVSAPKRPATVKKKSKTIK